MANQQSQGNDTVDLYTVAVDAQTRARNLLEDCLALGLPAQAQNVLLVLDTLNDIIRQQLQGGLDDLNSQIT